MKKTTTPKKSNNVGQGLVSKRIKPFAETTVARNKVTEADETLRRLGLPEAALRRQIS